MAADIRFTIGADDKSASVLEKARKNVSAFEKVRASPGNLDRWATALGKDSSFSRALENARNIRGRFEAFRSAIERRPAGAGFGAAAQSGWDRARASMQGMSMAANENASSVAKAARSATSFGASASQAYGGIAGAASQSGALAESAGEAAGGVAEAASSIGALGEGALAAAGPIGAFVAAMTAVGVAGVKAAQIGDRWAYAGAQISRTAQAIGASTVEVQSIAGAAQLSGVAFDTSTASLNSFGKTLNDAATGRNSMAQALLNQLHIVPQWKNGMLDVTGTLLKVSDAISHNPNPYSKEYIAQAFGLTGMLPALRSGSTQLRQDMADYMKTGSALTQQQIDNDVRLARSAELRHDRWQAVKKDFGQALTPWAQSVDNLEISAFTYVDKAINGWVALFSAIDKANDRLQSGTGPALHELALGWSAFKDVMSSGWDEAAKAFGGFWDRAVKTAKPAWDTLKPVFGAFGTMANSIVVAWTPVGPFFAGLWDGIVKTFDGAWDKIRPRLDKVGSAFADMVARNPAIAALAGAAAAGANAGRQAGEVDKAKAAQARGLQFPAAPTPARAAALVPAAPTPARAAALAQMVAQLKARGLDDVHASGVAAGMFAESRLDPNLVNPSSGAFGLGQWLKDRKTRLFAAYGPHPSQAQQLDFLVWELNGGDRGGRSVLGASSAADVARAYVQNFMRPKQGYETSSDLQRAGGALGVMGEGSFKGYLAGAMLSAGVLSAAAPAAATTLPPDPIAAFRAAEQPAGGSYSTWTLPKDAAVAAGRQTAAPPPYANAVRTAEATARLQGLPPPATPTVDPATQARPEAALATSEILVRFLNAPRGMVAESRPGSGVRIKLRVERSMDDTHGMG